MKKWDRDGVADLLLIPVLIYWAWVIAVILRVLTGR